MAENPNFRLVVYPNIYREWLFGISSINSITPPKVSICESPQTKPKIPFSESNILNKKTQYGNQWQILDL